MGEHLELSIVTGGMTGGLTGGVTVTVVIRASSEPPRPPATDNEFIPEDRDIGECITALPKPGCGSEARSDWHQGLVLSLMVLGLVFVGWRIVRGVRRRDAKPNDVDITPR